MILAIRLPVSPPWATYPLSNPRPIASVCMIRAKSSRVMSLPVVSQPQVIHSRDMRMRTSREFGERKSGRRRYDHMVRECFRSVFLAQKSQHGEKLQKATRPTMHEQHRDGFGVTREKSDKVDLNRFARRRIEDWDNKVWEGVDL